MAASGSLSGPRRGHPRPVECSRGRRAAAVARFLNVHSGARMSPTATSRASALERIKNLRPSNPRSPVTVNFDQGRGTISVPPGSEWAEDTAKRLLWLKAANGVLRLYGSTAAGGAREIHVPVSQSDLAYAYHFPPN